MKGLLSSSLGEIHTEFPKIRGTFLRVDVLVDVTDERLSVIAQLASGAYDETYTFAAVSQETRQITGYVYATFCEQTRHICHKVDQPHQGRSLGGLFTKSAEANDMKHGSRDVKVKLTAGNQTSSH